MLKQNDYIKARHEELESRGVPIKKQFDIIRKEVQEKFKKTLNGFAVFMDIIEKLQNVPTKNKTKASEIMQSLKKKAVKLSDLQKDGISVNDLEEAAKEFADFEIYISRDNWGKEIVGLFPTGFKTIELPKKEYTLYQGEQQLYNAVQSNQEMANIYPLSDIHYGHHAFDEGKFKEYIARIASDKYGLCILCGDLIDNALFDSVGGSIYESSMNPDSQLDGIIKLLRPISGKIISSVGGNHEVRTAKKAGVDIASWIAEKLQVPYRRDLMFLDLLLGGKRFSFYVWHGASNSMTAGGKLNAAMRPNNHTGFVNFYVSGHVHDPIVKPFETFHPNPENLTVEQRTSWIVINGAMLKYFNTYGSEKSWQPPSGNSIVMKCYDNGDYNAGFLS